MQIYVYSSPPREEEFFKSMMWALAFQTGAKRDYLRERDAWRADRVLRSFLTLEVAVVERRLTKERYVSVNLTDACKRLEDLLQYPLETLLAQ
jgi:hypothetical protein